MLSRLKKEKKIYYLGIIAISCSILFARLGYWQWQRANTKQNILEQLSSSSLARAATLTKLPTDANAFTKVKITGVFDTNNIFLIENQFYQHQLGTNVIIPLRSKNFAILVNCGWLTTDKNFIVSHTLQHQLQVTGLLQPSNSGNLRLGADLPKIGNIQHIQRWWPQELQARLPYKISTQFTLVLASTEPSVTALQQLQDNFQPITISPTRHRAYAWQWLSLALLCIILYLYAWCSW